MLKNYFISAFRNIKRNKISSVISIFGLSLGIMVLTFYILFLRYDLSIDQWPEHGERIFRFIKCGERKDKTIEYRTNVGNDWGPALKNEFGVYVEDYLNITHQFGNLTCMGKSNTINHGFLFTNPSFFNFFKHTKVNKIKLRTFSRFNSVLVTRSAIQKYFSGKNPIGEEIIFNNPSMLKPLVMTVAGIIDDPPVKSHLRYCFLASEMNLYKMYPRDRLRKDHEVWTYCYIKLRDKNLRRQMSNELNSRLIINDTDLMVFNRSFFKIEPLRAIYLSLISGVPGERKGNPFLLIIIGVIVVFLNIVASLNVAYLILSRFSYRQEEILIRRILGAKSKDLLIQLLIESMLLSFLALIFSISMTELLLPNFLEIVDRPIKLFLFDNLPIFFIIIGLSCVIGLLSGLYPARFISKSRLTMIKSSEHVKSKKIRFFLLSGQFILSIMLFFITLLTIHQFDYLQNSITKLDEDPIIYFEMKHSKFFEKYDKLKPTLLKYPGVLSITAASHIGWRQEDLYKYYFLEDNEKSGVDLNVIYVDSDYAKTFNYDIETYSDRQYPPILSHYYINEAGKNAFKWNYAIGQVILQNHSEFTIRGIVEDFNYVNPVQRVEPLVIVEDNQFSKHKWKYLIMRISREHFQYSRELLERYWINDISGVQFEPILLNKELTNTFNTFPGKVDWSFILAASISIAIAFAGLFGLVSFDMQQRIKELSIRRILGSSRLNIILQIFYDFSLPVFFAHLIAIPVSIFIFIFSLKIIGYPYSIIFYWYDLLLTFGIFMFLSFLSIGIQMIKTVSWRPVLSMQMD